MTTHFHIPGSFEPHALHPNVFLPPTSPATPAHLAPFPGSSNHAEPPQKRKRDDTRENTPVHNNRYVLADGHEGLADSVHSDVAYRRQMGPRGGKDEGEGWMGAIGGVMGRVWQFCTAGAFGGFYAGGGRGYSLDEGAQMRPEDFGRGLGGPQDTDGGLGTAPQDTGRGFGAPKEATRGFGQPPQDTARPFSDRDFTGTPSANGRNPDTNTPRAFDFTTALGAAPDIKPQVSPTQPSAKRRHGRAS